MSWRLFGFIFSSVALNALAQIALRKAMLSFELSGGFAGNWVSRTLDLALNRYLLVGIAFYVVSMLIWLAVLAKVEVGVAYPFQSMGYVIAAVVGFALLGEQLSAPRLFGIAFIGVGLVLIARSA